MSLLDEENMNIKTSPEYDVNPISRILFTWMNDIFKKGRKEVLNVEDIYLLDKSRAPGIFY